MTKDEALKTRLQFGQYKNKELGWVWSHDSKYLYWLKTQDFVFDKYVKFSEALIFLLGDD